MSPAHSSPVADDSDEESLPFGPQQAVLVQPVAGGIHDS